MFGHILCALDGSDHARKALSLALDLAAAGRAKLTLIQVLLASADSRELKRFAEIEGLAGSVEPAISDLAAVEGRYDFHYDAAPRSQRYLVEIGQKLLDEAKEDAAERGIAKVETILTGGDPAAAILRAVEDRKVDCVVLGARGLSDVEALFLGSVSHKVANRVACTCIVVK